MNILVVDDDLFELAVHINELRERGAVIHELNSVSEAMVYVADLSIALDLVIIDVMMPTETLFSGDSTEDGRLTGICLAEMVHELRPSVKIALITVRKDQRFLSLLPNLPIAGILFKPCTPRDFCERVQEILKG
jgi:DNA-binding NarL/FixJ family response regulator